MFFAHCSSAVAPIVAPPRHNVHPTSLHLLAHFRHVTTSPRAAIAIFTNRLNSSDLDCLCFGLPKQQYRTQQLAATSQGSSYLHAPLIAVSSRLDPLLRRNSDLHEQSQLSISALSTFSLAEAAPLLRLPRHCVVSFLTRPYASPFTLDPSPPLPIPQSCLPTPCLISPN